MVTYWLLGFWGFDSRELSSFILFSLHFNCKTPNVAMESGASKFIQLINLDSYAGFRLSGLNGPSQLCSMILGYIFTLFQPYKVDQVKTLIP